MTKIDTYENASARDLGTPNPQDGSTILNQELGLQVYKDGFWRTPGRRIPYDLDVALWLDSTVGIEAAAGGNVTSWVDRALVGSPDQGLALTEATNPPTLSSGVRPPHVHFVDASSQTLSVGRGLFVNDLDKLTAVVRVRIPTDADGYFIGRYASTGDQRSWGMKYDSPDDRWEVIVTSDGDTTGMSSWYHDESLDRFQWLTLAFTYDEGTVRMYLEGEEVTANPHLTNLPAGASLFDSTADLELGVDAIFVDFDLRHVMIFNRVLTPAQIKAVHSDIVKHERSSNIDVYEQMAVDALALSNWTWTPVAGTIPKNTTGYYDSGVEVTGLPYSSTKHVGKAIGEEISLKTFMAAIANPQSVMYTEDLDDYGDLNPLNASAYYGVVCSKITGYANRLGVSYLSRFTGPGIHEDDYGDHKGCVMLHDLQDTGYDADVTPPKVGDVLWTSNGGHTQMITNVNMLEDGTVESVWITEAGQTGAQTTTTTKAALEAQLNAVDPSAEYALMRVTNPEAYQGNNSPTLFPDYSRTVPTINTDLLLDRGDWVPYTTSQPVKFNVLSSSAVRLIVFKSGVEYLRRGVSGTGVIEIAIIEPGDYTAYVEKSDGTVSQSCEFAVCECSLTAPSAFSLSSDYEVSWKVQNCRPLFIFYRLVSDLTKRKFVYLNDSDRIAKKYVLPGGTLSGYTGTTWVTLVAEHPLGRVSSVQNGVIASA